MLRRNAPSSSLELFAFLARARERATPDRIGSAHNVLCYARGIIIISPSVMQWIFVGSARQRRGHSLFWEQVVIYHGRGWCSQLSSLAHAKGCSRTNRYVCDAIIWECHTLRSVYRYDHGAQVAAVWAADALVRLGHNAVSRKRVLSCLTAHGRTRWAVCARR